MAKNTKIYNPPTNIMKDKFKQLQLKKKRKIY